MVRITVLFCLMLLMSACAPKIVPIKSPGVTIQESYSVLTKKDYDIAIEPASWNAPPSNLETYFMVFYVILRNKTNDIMNVPKSSFALLDDAGEQYSIFTPKEVVKIMYGDNQYFDLNYFMNFDDNNKDELKEEYETRLEGIRNIMLKSFQFESIRPQAQESGYLFFERVKYKKQAILKIFYKEDVMEFLISR